MIIHEMKLSLCSLCGSLCYMNKLWIRMLCRYIAIGICTSPSCPFHLYTTVSQLCSIWWRCIVDSDVDRSVPDQSNCNNDCNTFTCTVMTVSELVLLWILSRLVCGSPLFVIGHLTGRMPHNTGASGRRFAFLSTVVHIHSLTFWHFGTHCQIATNLKNVSVFWRLVFL